MFKTRLLSGIVLVIIAFATIFLGGDVLFATLLIISLIGVSELYKVVKIEKAPLGIVGYIGVVAYYFLIRAQKKEDLMMFAIILLILVMAVYVFAFPKYVSEQVMTAYFGVFYGRQRVHNVRKSGNTRCKCALKVGIQQRHLCRLVIISVVHVMNDVESINVKPCKPVGH